MDSVFSVKRLLLVLLTVPCMQVFAADYFWTISGQGSLYDGPTPAAACRAYFDAAGPSTHEYFPPHQMSVTQFQCRMARLDNGLLNSFGQAFRRGDGCPAGTTYNSATGVCEGPPPPQCTAGRTFEANISQGLKTGSGTTDMQWPSNVSGCAVAVDRLIECYSTAPNAEGQRPVFCRYALRETGEAGSGNSQTPVPVPTDPKRPETGESPWDKGGKCPAGTVNVGTGSNGTPICSGSGTNPPQPPKIEVTQPPVTTQNPDGSTTTVEKTTRSNTDGSTTTTTKTTVTNPDGTTTTTVGSETSLRPGSTTQPGVDDSSDDKKDDFCKQHPELNLCKNSSVSGDCTAGYSCEGDSIQCAIMRQAAEQNCRDKKDRDDLQQSAQYTLGNSILGGNDPLKDTLPSPDKGERFDVDAQLDNSGWLGGGSCFPDKTINVAGWSFTIPFASVCDYLIGFRYLVMLLAAFQSLAILSRGVFGK